MPLDVNVFCYGYEGIDAVKAALKAGLARSTEDLPIKVSSNGKVQSATSFLSD